MSLYPTAASPSPKSWVDVGWRGELEFPCLLLGSSLPSSCGADGLHWPRLCVRGLQAVFRRGRGILGSAAVAPACPGPSRALRAAPGPPAPLAWLPQAPCPAQLLGPPSPLPPLSRVFVGAAQSQPCLPPGWVLLEGSAWLPGAATRAPRGAETQRCWGGGAATPQPLLPPGASEAGSCTGAGKGTNPQAASGR